MNQQDDFTGYHKKLLDGHYDCVDRIVLNGYFPLGQQGGGFRTWWRKLYGCDDRLDQKHLQKMAGRFSRRLRGWANKEAVPIIYCAPGTRKHELAQTYLPQNQQFQGLFLILVAKAPGLVWKVTRSKNGQPHLQREMRHMLITLGLVAGIFSCSTTCCQKKAPKGLNDLSLITSLNLVQTICFEMSLIVLVHRDLIISFLHLSALDSLENKKEDLIIPK